MNAADSPRPILRQEDQVELAAEAITVRIRWFGLCLGYILVDLLSRPIEPTNRSWLNGILSLGAVYALLDTYWSARGRVLFSRWPLFVSFMEAAFIGLLCHFDSGPQSPFLVYYFLSLLVCAIRYPRAVTFATFGLHAFSYATLSVSGQTRSREDLTLIVLVLICLGWVTWAVSALAELLKSARRRLAQLNSALEANQELLELRIAERTRQLQESQAQLVQHEKRAAFGLLAAGIAHEVGNPLAAISSLVQLLNRRQLDDYTREKLQLVDDQLHRIQGILRELVDFSRPATKERSMCDIHTVINAALNIAKYYKRTKGKRIVTSYAPGLPRLRVARDQLVQVLLNLVLNALDATAEGGTIQISTWLSEGWIRVGILDDGHGISPHHRDQIFEPYFTTKATGTGLGLFVCKTITEQELEGRIELKHSSSMGSQFVVSLTCDMVRLHPDVAEVAEYSAEVMTSETAARRDEAPARSPAGIELEAATETTHSAGSSSTTLAD